MEMKIAALVFPHQLYPDPSFFQGADELILVEEYLFFSQYRFHKQKLVFHRATLKKFEASVAGINSKTRYIEATDPLSDIQKLIPVLAKEGFTRLHIMDLADDWLENRIKKTAGSYGVSIQFSPSPLFLNKMEEVESYFEKRKTYFQTDFYTWQRKSRNILLNPEKGPVGGKWTFDSENRERFPKNGIVPPIRFPDTDQIVRESMAYVERFFPDSPGELKTFIYPTDPVSAREWLEDFLLHRFAGFGPYEDAMVARESFLHHSLISPLLNSGLLRPDYVVERALAVAEAQSIPLSSLEGFIRQIIGWREFIRIVYEREGRLQRTKNYWGHTRRIPRSFWTRETGIVPVDTVIKRVLKTGYCHHIERLMVLGNFMLLCEFDPDEVYTWFMEMFIDSYDWVMVPNVYGMSQFADGGLMTTKPYISGSNYLLKMGDWEKGRWQEKWDGLFWRFLHIHRDFFTRNPRLGMLVKTFDKMPAEKRRNHIFQAESFLDTL